MSTDTKKTALDELTECMQRLRSDRCSPEDQGTCPASVYRCCLLEAGHPGDHSYGLRVERVTSEASEDGDAPVGSRLWRCEQELAKARDYIRNIRRSVTEAPFPKGMYLIDKGHVDALPEEAPRTNSATTWRCRCPANQATFGADPSSNDMRVTRCTLCETDRPTSATVEPACTCESPNGTVRCTNCGLPSREVKEARARLCASDATASLVDGLFETPADRVWAEAMMAIRARGGDPEEMVRRAAKNLADARPDYAPDLKEGDRVRHRKTGQEGVIANVQEIAVRLDSGAVHCWFASNLERVSSEQKRETSPDYPTLPADAPPLPWRAVEVTQYPHLVNIVSDAPSGSCDFTSVASMVPKDGWFHRFLLSFNEVKQKSPDYDQLHRVAVAARTWHDSLDEDRAEELDELIRALNAWERTEQKRSDDTEGEKR